MANNYGKDWNKARNAAIKRDNGKCNFCGCSGDIHVHHIRPLSRGGTNEPYNLVTLCADCHRREHKDINADGLCTIPGPEYGDHWYELTDHEDVMRYADQLDQQGIGGDILRIREMER